MAINTALLIAAPILQDYFSDNATDAAMSDGVITCYQDNSRTTLKNWYYQSGSPGAYTYTQLPNPLVLSAAGTITDANGNDTIPFWYPYSEADNTTFQPYYVTMDNSNGQRQFTRQNFPFVANPGASNTFLSTLTNLITNNVFWRNSGSLALTNTLNTRICPSQHDGFVDNMSDMTFTKNATGATDTITFTQFTNATQFPASTNDGNPEYYMNISCGSSGSSETTKYIQIPICLHVANLSGYATASVTLWTQNVSGSANNTLRINLYQFLGTGASSPIATTIGTINPSSGWVRTVFNFSFPLATIPAGGPGDDGWFLQIALPVGVQFNMNIAKPSVYLSSVVPVNDFQTYEVVSGTIDSPRTGDIRTSLNSYFPFGWVTMNDGTIGNASSNATTRANIDTWPLFSLLWNNFKAYDSGSNSNPIAQIYTSASAATNYGATAIADFNANKQLNLTKMMGKLIMGTVPLSSLLSPYSQTVTASNSAGSLAFTGSTSGLFTGQSVAFVSTATLPDAIVANAIYYMIIISPTVFELATSYVNALSGTAIAYGSTSGSGTITAEFNIDGSLVGGGTNTLTQGNLPASFNMTLPSTTLTNLPSTGAQTLIGITGGGNTGLTATISGGSTPFNIIPPVVFNNFYMKL